MRLIFVRHGEPDYENDCLTENGKIQAKSTAERLKKEPIKAIFSSPMGRARETASYTAKNHGLDIQILDFMHEINWGDAKTSENAEKLPYDGHPWTLSCELLAENPEYAKKDSWKSHPFFKNNICMEYYEKISIGFDAFLEKFGLIRKNGLYRCETPCEDTIALFAHGGSGGIMFSHVLNLPLPVAFTTLPYGVCSVSIINFECEKGKTVIPRLELFNDMNHIDSVKLEKLHFEK